jgi:hypothetical protein
MTRSTVAVTMVALAALLGAWESAAAYGLAETYADPTRSSFHNLANVAGLALLLVALVGVVAMLGMAVARGRLRRVLAGAGVAIVVATAGGVLLGNHLGVMAKAVWAAETPHCGIGDRGLDRAFQELEHPGFFGGGSSSRVHCSYLLTSADVGASLTDYEHRLVADGWQVGRASDGTLHATREDLRFRVAVRGERSADPFLTVALRRVS